MIVDYMTTSSCENVNAHFSKNAGDEINFRRRWNGRHVSTMMDHSDDEAIGFTLGFSGS